MKKVLLLLIVVLVSIIICETYIIVESTKMYQNELDSITQFKDIILNTQANRIKYLEDEVSVLEQKNIQIFEANGVLNEEVNVLKQKLKDVEILEERILQNESTITDLKNENEKLKSIKYSQSLKKHFTNEEYEMLCYAVQGEAGAYGIEHIRLIAWTITNRVGNPRFGNTIKEVLLQKNQYVSMLDYGKKHREISPNTARAVSEVLYGVVSNNSQGSLFFYAPIYIKHQWQIDFFENNYQYLYTIDGVHRFLK